MKVPGVAAAAVPKAKITSYLLSRTHPTGRAKAAFFSALGFAPENWRALADALIRHAAENEVTTVDETRFGTKYTVEGSLDTPAGPGPVIRVVWFVEKGQTSPRLVTAYPRQRVEK